MERFSNFAQSSLIKEDYIMNSDLAFNYLIAFLSGRPINAEGAAQLMLLGVGTVVSTKVYRFK